MKKFVEEFKAFIAKGNVIDMAVAVVMGAAFGAIITSLVNDIIMPLIGLLTGGVDIAALNVTVGDAVIAYGAFIQAIINFVLIAFCIFLILKGLLAAKAKIEAKKKKEEEEAPAEDPKPTAEELLTEIRDLLKKD